VHVNNLGRRTIGLAVAAALAGAASPASAQLVKTDRMDARRYNTLRALAEYVDDGAEFTLEEARAAVGTSRNARERNLMTALRNFQQQARRFHNRVDQYDARPWRVETDLNRLRTAARNVNTQLRRVPAMSAAFQDWDMVIADINDMTRVASGAEVTLRRPTARWNTRVGEHHVSEWPTYNADTLRGQRLEDFRRLARELDTAASRAYSRARAQRADYSSNGAQLLVDLEHFAGQATQVRRQTDAGDVRPRDIGPLVTHLLEDARRADASMRRTRVYTGVWDEWGGVIRTLEQMSPLVR
jgi:hypothetical protein